MKKRSCYIVNRNEEIKKMFEKRGWNTNLNHQESEVLVFTGGADVTPFLYGEKLHKTSKPNMIRDLYEIRMVKEAPANKPKIGICRGAQLLNVLSGGTMWQNVNNHTTPHTLYDVRSGEMIRVTSTHHQMMVQNEHGEVLAIAGMSTLKESDSLKFDYKPDKDDPETWEDNEVIWYEHTKSLCFQPHPEYTNAGKECEDYFFSLVNELIIPSLVRKDLN